MDYKEEINKAAKHYGSQATSQDDYGKLSYQLAWERGALSDEAKAYWYNEFKVNELSKLDAIPFKQIVFGTGGGSTYDTSAIGGIASAIPDGILNQIYWPDYQQYIKDNPDRPISFDKWKYMVEHYPEITEEVVEAFSWIDKDGFDVLSGKKEPTKSIGIIGHVDHGKTMMVTLGAKKIVDTIHGSSVFADMSNKIILLKNRRGGETIMIHEDFKNSIFDKPIKSIVPIADVIPEPLYTDFELKTAKAMNNGLYEKMIACNPTIISKVKMEDIKPWDIKKEKKENHKRNNKRK